MKNFKNNIALILFVLGVAVCGFCVTVAPYWVSPRWAAVLTGIFAFAAFVNAVGMAADYWKKGGDPDPDTVEIVVLNDGETFTDRSGCTIRTVLAEDYYRTASEGGDARDMPAKTVHRV